MFCPIPAVEHVPGPLAHVAVGGGSPQHRELEPGVPANLLCHSNRAGPRHTPAHAPQPRASALLQRRQTQLPSLASYWNPRENCDLEGVLQQASIPPIPPAGAKAHGSGMPERDPGRRGRQMLGSEIWVPILATPLKSGMTWARDITFLIRSVFIFGTTSSYSLPRVFVNINCDSD